MEAEVEVEVESTTSQPSISPADRIKELNSIDTDVSKVLAIASRAIGMLANTDHGHTNPTLEEIQNAFNEESKKYFASIASIDVRLRRQVHALEEAGLIPAGSRVDRSLAMAMTEDQGSRRGGGGPLDSSWLNARAKNTVGKSLKEEALKNSKEFLRKNGIEVGGKREEKQEKQQEIEDENEDEDEDMFGDDDT